MKTNIDSLATSLEKWKQSNTTVFRCNGDIEYLIKDVMSDKIEHYSSLGIPLSEDVLTLKLGVVNIKKMGTISTTIPNEVDIVNRHLHQEFINGNISGTISLLDQLVTLKSGRKVSLAKYTAREKILNDVEYAKFVEYLKLLKGEESAREVYLTIDPYKMMRSSTNCTYKSCYRPSGEYAYAPTTYVLTKEAGMLYTLNDNGLKDFRAWVLLKENLIVVQKLYGDSAIVEDVAKLSIRELENLLGVDRELETSWDSLCTPDSNAFYLDNPYHSRKYTNNPVRCINLKEPIDEYGNELVGRKCECCGEYCDGNDMTYVDGADICPDCLSLKYFYCVACDSYHSIEHTNRYRVTSSRVYGSYVCERCLIDEDYGFICEDCGDVVVSNDRNITIDNTIVCDCCIDAYQYGFSIDYNEEGYVYTKYIGASEEVDGTLYITEYGADDLRNYLLDHNIIEEDKEEVEDVK